MNTLGFGQILWDLTVNIDYQLLKDLGFSKSGHHLVKKETLQEIIEKIQSSNKTIIKNPGGSCANVMSNMAKLGSQTAFYGKHGNDENGFNYMEILAQEGVKTCSIIDNENSTGQLLSILTPDKDRTFIVYWGAAEYLPADAINDKLIRAADNIHLEGYLVINSQEVLWKIFEQAKRTTYDLAAHSVIEKTRPILQKMMKEYPPYILFANLFEGKTFTLKNTPEEILDEMLRYTEIAVLTMGEQGVVIKTLKGECLFERAVKTKVIDTTGAGDSFSAGFLHEFFLHRDITRAAKLGVRTSSATIRKIGARSLQIQQLKVY